MPTLMLAVIADVVAFEAGVDDGPLLQGHDGGAHEERHEGEARTVALLESGFVFRTNIHDAGEIHFVHAVNVSAGAARLDHVLGDQFAHVRHGNKIARDGGWRLRRSRPARCAARDSRGGCRGRGSLRSLGLDELHDVLFGDAATESGAGDLREADAVFAGDLADERGGAGFFVVFLG